MKLLAVPRPYPSLTQALVGAFLVLVASGAAASHKVYSPHVEKGELELEVRSHVDSAGARKDKYEVGYGFNDWWFSSVFLEYQQSSGTGLAHSATSWENIFQLTEPGKYWLDTGLYLEYESPATGGPAKLETKVLLEKPVGRYVNTANFVFAREVGAGASNDINLEYAWRTKFKFKPEFEPGIELYGTAGTLANARIDGSQEAQLGPVVAGKFRVGSKGAIAYEIGYLFGLNSASPQGTTKWLLEYEYAL